MADGAGGYAHADGDRDNFTASVGYNCTQPHWHEPAVGGLANEAVDAADGGAAIYWLRGIHNATGRGQP